jgi:hypothetical protein
MALTADRKISHARFAKRVATAGAVDEETGTGLGEIRALDAEAKSE